MLRDKRLGLYLGKGWGTGSVQGKAGPFPLNMPREPSSPLDAGGLKLAF